MYMETDASLVEINPLVILKDGGVVALDAKVNFDENALFRHKDLLEYRDIAEEDAARGRRPRSATSRTSRSRATSAAW